MKQTETTDLQLEDMQIQHGTGGGCSFPTSNGCSDHVAGQPTTTSAVGENVLQGHT